MNAPEVMAQGGRKAATRVGVKDSFDLTRFSTSINVRTAKKDYDAGSHKPLTVHDVL